MEAIYAHCSLAKLSSAAQPNWSPQAALLITDKRQARRRYNTTEEKYEQVTYQKLSSQLKKKIMRINRAN